MAVDPVGIGGVVLKGPAGPLRDAWMSLFERLLPNGTPVRRVPVHINDERLLGGLDLTATLQAGRPVAQRGILTQADGGVVVLAMAERLAAPTAARIVAVLDTHEVVLERDGLATRTPARFGVIAFDEGQGDDERVSAALLDRLAFTVDLSAVPRTPSGSGDVEASMAQVLAEMPGWEPTDISAARSLLADIDRDDALVEALVGTALALGVESLRAPSLALRVARAAAALDGRRHLIEQDVELAAVLVLAPRATRVPAPPPPADEASESDPPPPPPPSADDADSAPPPAEAASEAEAPPPEPPPSDEAQPPAPMPEGALDDRVLAAAQAAIPAGLLEALQGSSGLSKSSSAGRAGAQTVGQRRGRPNGTRRGEPRAGARLNVIETLRAAAPWQTVRRVELERAAAVVAAAAATAPVAHKAARGAAKASTSAALRSHPAPSSPRILVRREDFHINRVKQRTATTTVFVVDASGSSALNRLAEAKGAVELLLADCYVRRDQVAVLAFRGQGCELLLPPTRSLVRAKRSLAGLPGGGGTPLASAIDAAAALGESIARRGDTPVIVLLTDGRGNIARDGSPGRARATEDVSLAARQFRAVGLGALLIDTSPQPVPAARQLAMDMGATYLPLPYAGSSTLSKAVGQAVRAVQSSPSSGSGSSAGQTR